MLFSDRGNGREVHHLAIGQLSSPNQRRLASTASATLGSLASTNSNRSPAERPALAEEMGATVQVV